MHKKRAHIVIRPDFLCVSMIARILFRRLRKKCVSICAPIFGKMFDFGESYQKKQKTQRTTRGTGECGAGLPDPPQAAAATAGAAAGAAAGAGVEGATSAPLSPSAAQFDCTCVRIWFFSLSPAEASHQFRLLRCDRANSTIFKVRDFACFCGSKYVPSM